MPPDPLKGVKDAVYETFFYSKQQQTGFFRSVAYVIKYHTDGNTNNFIKYFIYLYLIFL